MNEQTQPKIHVPPKLPQQELKRSQSNGKKRQMILLIVLAVVIIGGGAVYFFFFIGDTNTNEETAAIEQANTTQPATNATALTNAATNEKIVILDVNDAVESTFNANVGTTANQNANVSPTTNTNAVVVMDLNTNTTSANINSGPTFSLGNSRDTDNDKVPNNIEIWYRTERTESDSDSDGYDDYTEIAGCYNPIGNGRIDSYDFIGYCFESLRGMGIQQNGNPPFRLQEYCNEWTMEAEILINEAVDGGDVNQVWTDMYLAGFDSRCEEMNDIDYGELTIDPDQLCSIAQRMLAGFCNPTHW